MQNICLRFWKRKWRCCCVIASSSCTFLCKSYDPRDYHWSGWLMAELEMWRVWTSSRNWTETISAFRKAIVSWFWIMLFPSFVYAFWLCLFVLEYSSQDLTMESSLVKSLLTIGQWLLDKLVGAFLKLSNKRLSRDRIFNS